ncbi:MAG: Uma2 family endonuclease [Polyangiaceae bacterium]|nr:Uma2 family endonuclease [Polyangiaceae bacterium]
MYSPLLSTDSAPEQTISLTYCHVIVRKERWVLTEENMPEATNHRDATDLLKLILLAFVARAGKNALVVANLGCRWDVENPSFGVDPDIALIEPVPPNAPPLSSLLTWKEGCVPPRFAVEIVSATNPNKDYLAAPAKYAALGVGELVIFDPELFGPAGADGPHVLQVWRRKGKGHFARVYAGVGPVWSAELNAWLIHCEGKLRIADDFEGKVLWPTEAEAEAAARKREAAGRKREAEARANAEDALRQSIEDMCDLCGVHLTTARREHIQALDTPGLNQLRAHIKAHRNWPE